MSDEKDDMLLSYFLEQAYLRILQSVMQAEIVSVWRESIGRPATSYILSKGMDLQKYYVWNGILINLDLTAHTRLSVPSLKEHLRIRKRSCKRFKSQVENVILVNSDYI